ncbi:MAG: flagellar protein FlaG [Woeseiaceae bacterium]|nr:flagellar protein FlaG [Woeseiaceae bacterium]
MSDQDVKIISSATGSFRALSVSSERPTLSGKEPPQPGKDVPEPKQQEPDLEALAAKLNVASQSIGRDLRFKVNMNSGQSVIQVLDRETGEIIREIPPEKADVSLSINGDVELRLYDRVV